MSGIHSMMVASYIPQAAGGSGDSYISNVDTLLHFDGANASTTITNSISGGLAWSKGGYASSFVTTERYKFGSGSFVCQSGTGAIAASSSPGIYGPATLANGSYVPRSHWWANDTTVESFVYVRSNTAGGQFAIWYAFGTPRFNAGFWDTDSGASMKFKVEMSLGGSTTTYTPGTGGAGYYDLSWTIGNSILNTWAHIALVRSGNALKLFINGTDQGTGSLVSGSGRDSTNIFAAGNPYVGTSGLGAQIAIGDMGNYTDYGFRNSYIDEFRFTNAVARYTTTFSAPTAAFPDA